MYRSALIRNESQPEANVEDALKVLASHHGLIDTAKVRVCVCVCVCVCTCVFDHTLI